MGDERAGDYTRANQALISRLHTRSAIGADTDAAPHPDSRNKTCHVLKRIRSFLKTMTAAVKAMAA
jgi:hypothetical protein